MTDHWKEKLMKLNTKELEKEWKSVKDKLYLIDNKISLIKNEWDLFQKKYKEIENKFNQLKSQFDKLIKEKIEYMNLKNKLKIQIEITNFFKESIANETNK